jgi:methanogenic corrinoid protein MtbC1
MSGEFDDGLVLALLSDAELVEQMWADLRDGYGGEIVDGVHILLNRGWEPERIVERVLAAGMRVALDAFHDGEIAAGELVLSADALQAGMDVLRPYLPQPEDLPLD